MAGVTAGIASDALPRLAWGGTTAATRTSPAAAPELLQLSLGSTRSHFSTAEPVEVALAHLGSVDNVTLEARHEDGSVVHVRVPLLDKGRGRWALVTFPAGMLKPGAYSVVASDGTARAPHVDLAVHSGDHPSAYFVAAWMQRDADPPTVLAKGGWMFFTSDLVHAHVRTPATGDILERYVAAGMKPFAMTVMGGGHQINLDLKNDWGDPWVQRAVTWRMGLSALSNRLYPMAGVHAFDEPGLTWWPFFGPDGKTIGVNAFSVPVHVQEFLKLTGTQMPTGPIDETVTRYFDMKEAWRAFVAMRLRYLEQAWWAVVAAVDQVHAPFLAINQLASSYAPGLVADGVDSRMNRPFRVLSGHGGYSDWAGSWGAVLSARSFDGWAWDRPHYYVPSWGPWDYARMRQEVWLAWCTKLEGIQYFPDFDWSLSANYRNAVSVLEIAEVNRRMALVGDVMKRMPRTRSPVALLMSHTQFAEDVADENHPKPIHSPGYRSTHREQLITTAWRVMGTGRTPNWIDEAEVVEKGVEFLKNWSVVYCPALSAATPEFARVLGLYAAAGGKLVQGEKDRLHIAGATRVAYAYEGPHPPPDHGPLFNDYALRKYAMDLAPGFAGDLETWIGPETFRSAAPENTMLMSVHRVGGATYVLMGNNHQDPQNTRHVQMDPVPLETTVRVPQEGVLYDLLNGGPIDVRDGKAPLELAAGDGACWLHLPAPPGEMALDAAPMDSQRAIAVHLKWGGAGYLPFRLRLYDPAGNLASELFRATTPWEGAPLSYGPGDRSPRLAGDPFASVFRHELPLGANAAPGTWTVEAHEWLTGSTTKVAVAILAPAATKGEALLEGGLVSIFYDDAKKIRDLLAGRPSVPTFEKMNWDASRVFGLDAKRFAVFGPDEAAGRISSALRAKGMTAEVNPAYEIVPFKREPEHGGTGPIYDSRDGNFENIYAHAIVLPGHPLGQVSWKRGHINRPTTPTFPGPGRAYVQWGVGGYQAGFHDIWVFGDVGAGVDWLLAAIEGKEPPASSKAVSANVRAAPARAAKLPARFTVTQEIKLSDTPVGIGSSPDGGVTYVLVAGGSVSAHDSSGRVKWKTQALLQGGCLAVSPRGDRLAVGGFPGLFVMDAGNGAVLGGYQVGLPGPEQSLGSSRMIAAAWSDDGAMVAAAGIGPAPMLAVLDAQGRMLPLPRGVDGDVSGVAFAPGGKRLLLGAGDLVAVEASTGVVAWRGKPGGAQSIRFAADGATGVAGGWGRSVASFRLSDGKAIVAADFPANVGGVAVLPDGSLAAAVWGGTRPLYRITAQSAKPETLLQSRFAFHDVLWMSAASGLVAAEQGGTLWLLDERGRARAKLDDAGTTAIRMEARGKQLLVGRMSRVVQRVTVG